MYRSEYIYIYIIYIIYNIIYIYNIQDIPLGREVHWWGRWGWVCQDQKVLAKDSFFGDSPCAGLMTCSASYPHFALFGWVESPLYIYIYIHFLLSLVCKMFMYGYLCYIFFNRINQLCMKQLSYSSCISVMNIVLR